MNKLTRTLCIALAAIMLALTACEKPFVGMPEQTTDEPNTIFRITSFEQVDFDAPTSRAMVDITQICSRINLVVFNGDTKVKSIAQKASDKDFGTLALTLPQGTYTVAIIAHSTSASATVTSLDKISFDHNLISDTFLFRGEIVVGETAQTHDVQLRRVVAMFRLNLTKPLPAEVAQMKFYYTGGSSTLSANTGFGSVNSKQTVVLDVNDAQQVFDVFTFPHAESGELKITVTALDASQATLYERVFDEVPVTRNKITQYTGDFFEGNSSKTAATSFAIKAETEWDGHQTFNF